VKPQRGFPIGSADTARIVRGCGLSFSSSRILRTRRGFSLLDLLVSIAVIATLMAIMVPVLSKVTEATHRVMCQSNVRQLGLCLSLYADDNNDSLPTSVFSDTLERGAFQPQEMMTLRTSGPRGDWDGLGWLFQAEYVKTPEVFYCPSHKGEHAFEQYEDSWYAWGEQVLGNYHYRAFTGSESYLQGLDPRTALIADGMRTHLDFNHSVGTNVLRADLSVEWFADSDGALGQLLPPAVGALEADEDVYAAWWLLERGTLDEFPGLPWDDDGPGTLPGFEAFISDPT